MRASYTSAQAMAAEAYGAGVPRDQLRNFLLGGYVPQPKQFKFHAACRAADDLANPREIGFGGSKGPGKSHAMFAQIALDDCQRYPGLKCLMLRKVGRSLKESVGDLRRRVLHSTPHTYSKQTGEITFPNGSRIILGHFRTEADIDTYSGLEYDLIGVEECTMLSGEKYKLIKTCCRSSKPDWRPRMYSNANGGGVGHQFYYRRFIKGECADATFIPAVYSDNIFLDSDYAATLDDLTGWRRRAWRDGDWNIQMGQFFDNWNPIVHVVKPFPLAGMGFRFVMGVDYGWQHPQVMLLLANQGNKTYVVAEYGASKQPPEQHSAAWLAILGELGLSRGLLDATVIGSDALRAQDDGRNVVDKYAGLGWSLTTADMRRVAGAHEILRQLDKQTLLVFDTCPRLIEQLPQMQHNPRRTEDILKVNADTEGYGGDDYCDTLRYTLLEIVAGGSVAVSAGPVWRRR